MIKSKDNPNRKSSCLTQGEATTGIAFERTDGSQRFAPHSFLSCVDFDGANELTFRYTFCTITVQGEALQPLWNALCRGTLDAVIEQTGKLAGNDGTWVQAIIVEDHETSSDELAFPG